MSSMFSKLCSFGTIFSISSLSRLSSLGAASLPEEL
jgi:hypothetical protein